MNIEWPRELQICRMELAITLVRQIAEPFDLALRRQTLPAELGLALSTGHTAQRKSVLDHAQTEEGWENPLVTAIDLLDPPPTVHARTALRNRPKHRLRRRFLIPSLLPALAVVEMLASLASVPRHLVFQALLVAAVAAQHTIGFVVVQLARPAAAAETVREAWQRAEGIAGCHAVVGFKGRSGGCALDVVVV